MTTLTPNEFIAKWKTGGDERREFASFFDDLCRMLGFQTPREADPDKKWFTYEYGASKTTGGNGWADVWRKHRFGWEHKGTKKDLAAAYQQLKMYADAMANPPLLIVSDFVRFEIHTNFTNVVHHVYEFNIEDLAEEKVRRLLKDAFENPDALRPGLSRADLTRDAAEKFADLAYALRGRGHDAHEVAHFLNRLLFCMFAEDIGLLPDHIFKKLVESSQGNPDVFEKRIAALFGAMKEGGDFALNNIEWFNGGLFEDDRALRLETPELKTLLSAAMLDWSDIDPTIFGTLFERGLDPNKRSQLGAHYTDPDTIMKIVRPVIEAPLSAEWNAIKPIIEDLMARADAQGRATEKTKLRRQAMEHFVGFLHRLQQFSVLDPACGSGNFLFMALRTLKDLEHRVNREAEEMGLVRQQPTIGPANVHGIELNDYAAELARITIWIGEIQWMVQNGYGARKNPILQPLDQIEQRDALLNGDGTEASWPPVDVIIGNPPFIGGSKILGELGPEYTATIRRVYEGRVPGGADFVCYWFEKANDLIRANKVQRAGLVSTNSIRGGSNREVLKHASETTRIFDAWSDEPWTNEGAAVRVSMVCFGVSDQKAELNGLEVGEIFADLTAGGNGQVDLTMAKRLKENKGVAFEGMRKDGPFDIDGDLARKWLLLPANANGKKNADVLKPRVNGKDLTARGEGGWVIDFGAWMPVDEAAYFEAPFAFVDEVVRPVREKNNDRQRREKWWLFGRSNEDLRSATKNLKRFITTVRHSKHRLFTWMDSRVSPDTALVVIARDDDTTFGILHSKMHELWAIRTGSAIGVGNDPRYTPTTSFESFPFPDGFAPNIKASEYEKEIRAIAIASAARALNEARHTWLNPVEWTQVIPEVVPGYPDRIEALPIHAKELKSRTLTNLYNTYPTWLQNLHGALDFAVAQAYGWEWPLPDDEILRRLFELNQERSKPLV